jgi:hypothetical protein
MEKTINKDNSIMMWLGDTYRNIGKLASEEIKSEARPPEFDIGDPVHIDEFRKRQTENNDEDYKVLAKDKDGIILEKEGEFDHYEFTVRFDEITFDGSDTIIVDQNDLSAHIIYVDTDVHPATRAKEANININDYKASNLRYDDSEDFWKTYYNEKKANIDNSFKISSFNEFYGIISCADNLRRARNNMKDTPFKRNR